MSLLPTKGSESAESLPLDRQGIPTSETCASNSIVWGPQAVSVLLVWFNSRSEPPWRESLLLLLLLLGLLVWNLLEHSWRVRTISGFPQGLKSSKPDDIPNRVGPKNVDLNLWEIPLNMSMPEGLESYEVLAVQTSQTLIGRSDHLGNFILAPNRTAI